MDTKRQTLSVEEAAKTLGISRGCAYKAVHDGSLPTIRVSGRYLVPRAALDRLLGITVGEAAGGRAASLIEGPSHDTAP
jgi:excisionase family DNA binding protein